MNSNEVNQENIIVLVKLGIDVKDMANIYLNITQKGNDISKGEFINNLTNMIKFFQTRNKGMDENSEEAIFKEDVLEMISKNKKLISINLENKIKPICETLDSYYFMNEKYTNKVIKENPKIFNVNKIDLEIFATIFSEFAIKAKGETVSAYEYIIKHESTLLNEDIQKVYGRLRYIQSQRKSKLLVTDDLLNMQSFQFEYGTKQFSDKELKEMYELPKYSGTDLASYKKEILKQLK